MSFDILHNDLWTSPILSSSGHQYYVLFLDDSSDFLWIFPISNKSQVSMFFSWIFFLLIFCLFVSTLCWMWRFAPKFLLTFLA